MRSFFVPLGLAVLFTQPLLAAAQAAASSAVVSAVDPVSTEPDRLTLAAAIGLAFQLNPGLRAAARDLDIAAGQRIQAGARPNPELSYLSEGLQKDLRTTGSSCSGRLQRRRTPPRHRFGSAYGRHQGGIEVGFVKRRGPQRDELLFVPITGPSEAVSDRRVGRPAPVQLPTPTRVLAQTIQAFDLPHQVDH